MKKIKFAIIGCGRISYHHCWSLDQIRNASVVAVCDLKEDRAMALAKKNSVPYYLNYHRMLEKENIDVVIIATPSGMHGVHAIDVMKKYRKHVVVEKPMSLSISEAKRMISTSKKYGVHLFVVLQNRFNKAVQKLRHMIDHHELGRVVMGTIRLRWCRGQKYYDRDPWRGKWEFDGGVMTNQALHHIDLLRWFLGDPDIVSCKCSTQLANIEVEDTALGWIKFSGGSLGAIEATTAARPDDMEASLSLLCEKGAVVIEGTSVNHLTYCTIRGIQKKRFSETPPSVYGFGHITYFKNIIKVLSGREYPAIDAADALKTLKLLHCLYASDERNKPISYRSSIVSSRLGVMRKKNKKIFQMYFTPHS